MRERKRDLARHHEMIYDPSQVNVTYVVSLCILKLYFHTLFEMPGAVPCTCETSKSEDLGLCRGLVRKRSVLDVVGCQGLCRLTFGCVSLVG